MENEKQATAVVAAEGLIHVIYVLFSGLLFMFRWALSRAGEIDAGH